MLRLFCLASLLCVLCGCATSQAQSQMRQRAEAEEQAWEQFDKTVFDRCFGGRTLSQLRAHPPKRREFINDTNCRTRLINETVGPVAMYPDLLAKMRATALTNA